ncbi:hypothetical protein A2U01_0084195 [Trifolium medium]|uniref:Uncharacterized protein n=1 Tax=Trifolium medium TaxID=97028 RepID=A0A392TPW0_9FABA|nr:hypothetical protein [Trifolium medium]
MQDFVRVGRGCVAAFGSREGRFRCEGLGVAGNVAEVF